MPAIEGRLDVFALPLLDLRFLPTSRALTVVIDTGFDGELMVYYDDLGRLGIEATVDRGVPARLADGSEVLWPGAALTVDWFGEPRRLRAILVPSIRPSRTYPLIGCRLLRDSRLEIDFPRGTVRITRA